MGKKGKPDDPEQFEVWISTLDGWMQVEEKGNGGVFASKSRAMLLAESKSHGKDVVETMVIARRPVAVFNGEAISVKHKLSAVEKKKEIRDAQVHSGGEKEVVVPDAGPQLSSEAVPGGDGREGTPVGPG
jgi:hypothetical protein